MSQNEVMRKFCCQQGGCHVLTSGFKFTAAHSQIQESMCIGNVKAVPGRSATQ
ncbi:hypothetical protein LEMLEM_LOCUS8291 [Lemmus lemmus]